VRLRFAINGSFSGIPDPTDRTVMLGIIKREFTPHKSVFRDFGEKLKLCQKS
jgi:hypothetical protein